MSKTVFITGASSGIGKAAAIYFSGKGWNVVASMRSPEKEKELNLVDNVLVSRLDVQDPGTIETAIQEGIEKFGKIDILINNAGYGQFGLFEAATPEQIREQFDVNVFGVMNVTRAILPHFRQKKEGMILNISSGAGRFTLPLISLYAASKFALEGFSEALAYELLSQHIIVKIIEPGGTETNFSNVTDNGFAFNPALTDYDDFIASATKAFAGLRAQRLTTAEDVAEVIYNAATDGADTFRYVIGNEDFLKRMAAREKMPDQEYVRSMREGFVFKNQ